MGSLAFWGGVGGLGKGIEKNADATRKIEMDEIAEARAMRMERMRQQHQAAMQAGDQFFRGDQNEQNRQHQSELQSDSQNFRAGESGLTREHEEAMSVDRMSHQTGEKRLDREHESSERALDRESRESIADKRNTASASAAAKDRYKVTSMAKIVADEHGIKREIRVPVFFDNETQTFYEQHGSTKVPMNSPKLPMPEDAIAELKANPTEQNISFFLQTFGDLPDEFKKK